MATGGNIQCQRVYFILFLIGEITGRWNDKGNYPVRRENLMMQERKDT